MFDGLKTLRQSFVIAALMFLCAAPGCGQKGPLYLPDNPSEMQSVGTDSAPADESADDEDDDETDREP